MRRGGRYRSVALYESVNHATAITRIVAMQLGRHLTAAIIAVLLAVSFRPTPGRAEQPPTWYLSGLVGASFMTLTSGGTNTAGGFPNSGAASQGSFTGGGAIGRTLPLERGQWRIEVEGAQRALLSGTTNSIGSPFQYDVRAADGWSVTTNLWRDLAITDRFGLFLGGGIGGGGYRLSVDDSLVSGYTQNSAFAWQAGGGVFWNLTDRLTVDLSYRFLAINGVDTPLTFAGGALPAWTYRSALSANDLLLTFRVDEPFGWLRR